MNVLVIGGASILMNQLIRKIKKEGHRVYLLTGSRYRTAAYEKVFERYDLTYDSECLGDVFESVNPDVTVFMGAFDTNFRWANEERELVRLTSGLTNMLTAFAMAGKGRFIYLSSDAVYAENYEENIPEEKPTAPVSLQGMALAQCEDICASFQKNRDADVVTLRIDHYYQIPQRPEDVNDICAGMCMEALRDGKITADKGQRFTLLYESDAVEFIYKLIGCGEHRYSLYNLSGTRELTEPELAEFIRQALEEDTRINIVEKEEERRRRVLDHQRFDEEFGVRIFADPQETVAKVAKHMFARKNVFLTGEEEKKSFWTRLREGISGFFGALFPYVENLVVFILVLLLNNSSLGSTYLRELDLFLLYVLLFAVVYGQHQATFSAILAVIGAFISQIGDRTFLAVALDYENYIWIAQLFIVGLVVGYLKDQINKLKLESEEEQEFLGQQLSDIKDINGSNVRVKDALETEIVNQRDSVGKVYHITSRLEQYMPEEVLFYAAEMMGELLGSRDIAIYTVANNTYARLFTFTSERAKTLGKSLRYRELGELTQALDAGKVYINRNLDSRYPMMANAIYDNDRIQTMIMIWGIPWERMTLGQADMLTVISYLIQNAVLRATRLIAMLENRRYQSYGHVMEAAAFTSLVRAFLSARNKGLTECVMLQIPLTEEETRPRVGALPLPPVGETEETEKEEAARTEETARSEKTEKTEEKKGWFRRPLNVNFVLNKLSIEVSGASRKARQEEPREEKREEEPLQERREEMTAAAVPVVRTGSRLEEIGNALAGKIRQEDYIGTLEDGGLYILLTNSNSQDASFVIRRIENEGYRCVLLEDFSI